MIDIPENEIRAEIDTDLFSRVVGNLLSNAKKYNKTGDTISVKLSAEKYEPYIIARYLINLSQAFSSFYNENKIICEDKNVQDARLYLTYATSLVLKTGASLLGIQMPDRM